jgi:hypothetical protein
VRPRGTLRGYVTTSLHLWWQWMSTPVRTRDSLQAGVAGEEAVSDASVEKLCTGKVPTSRGRQPCPP